MLHPNKYFFLLTFLLSGIIFPQAVQSIKITGNKVYSSGEILSWSGVALGVQLKPGLIDSLKHNIAARLALRGYFYSEFTDTKIDTAADSTRVIVTLEIKEGKQAQFGDIVFTGADKDDSVNVISNFDYLKGQPYNSLLVEENISNALSFYEDNGYPFAKIKIISAAVNNDTVEGEISVRLNMQIVKDSVSRIDEIEIKGNESTKDYVITRELRIKKGETYSQEKIENLPARLNSLRFFEPVSTPSFYVNSKNEGVLLVTVKEKQTNNFDGILGYVPPPKEGDKGYLTGLVNVSLRNLFGTGRAAAIRWQQYDRHSQELELKYLEPWLFGFPFNIQGGLFQRKQDTTYVQRKFDGSVEYLATENISASVLIGTESIIPSDDSLHFSVYNSSSFTTGVSLKIDTRDDPYSPLSGIYFNNAYSFSQKKINGPLKFLTEGMETKINLQRIEMDFNAYYQVFQRQVIALGLHGRELRGSFFEESDLYRLGGTSSLRGYRESQFLGSRVLWTNLEYRLLLSRRTFVFAFFDTGYYLRNAEPERNIEKNEAFNMGYGMGLNLETGLGVLSVSYALGKGDSFKEGKIHFGIVNEF